MGTKASPAVGVLMIIMSIAFFALWWSDRDLQGREDESGYGYGYRRGMRVVAPIISVGLLVAGAYLILG